MQISVQTKNQRSAYKNLGPSRLNIFRPNRMLPGTIQLRKQIHHSSLQAQLKCDDSKGIEIQGLSRLSSSYARST